MADTVEEVYNQTIGNTTFSGGPATVLTTDANTRYVIRDIDIERSTALVDAGEFNMTAKINDVQVVDLTNGSVTGTAIIGPSSNLKLASTAYPFASSSYKNIKFTYPRVANLTSPGWVSSTEYEILSVTNLSDEDTGSEATAISPALNASPGNRLLYADANAVLWVQEDGNNPTVLYRRPTGTSTNTIINSTTYSPKAYDNYQKIYWTETSFQALKIYDIPTDTITTISITGPGAPFTQSSHPKGYFCNGFYFFNSSTSANEIRAVNVSNGVSYNIQFPSSITVQQDNRFSVGYVASEDKFYFNHIYTSSNTHMARRCDKTLATWNPAGEVITTASTSTVTYNGSSYNINASSSPAYMNNTYSSHLYQFEKILYWRSTLSPYTTIFKADCTTALTTGTNISTELTETDWVSSTEGRYFYYQPYTPSAAEIAATAYDYSNYNTKVRITAVKSV
jgi:hypothetical protein